MARCGECGAGFEPATSGLADWISLPTRPGLPRLLPLAQAMRPRACRPDVATDTVVLMPQASATAVPPIGSRQHHVLWVGASESADLELAQEDACRLVKVRVAATPAEAIAESGRAILEHSPAVILLATPTPGRWTLADAVRLTTCWMAAAAAGRTCRASRTCRGTISQDGSPAGLPIGMPAGPVRSARPPQPGARSGFSRRCGREDRRCR